MVIALDEHLPQPEQPRAPRPLHAQPETASVARISADLNRELLLHKLGILSADFSTKISSADDLSLPSKNEAGTFLSRLWDYAQELSAAGVLSFFPGGIHIAEKAGQLPGQLFYNPAQSVAQNLQNAFDAATASATNGTSLKINFADQQDKTSGWFKGLHAFLLRTKKENLLHNFNGVFITSAATQSVDAGEKWLCYNTSLDTDTNIDNLREALATPEPFDGFGWGDLNDDMTPAVETGSPQAIERMIKKLLGETNIEVEVENAISFEPGEEEAIRAFVSSYGAPFLEAMGIHTLRVAPRAGKDEPGTLTIDPSEENEIHLFRAACPAPGQKSFRWGAFNIAVEGNFGLKERRLFLESLTSFNALLKNFPDTLVPGGIHTAQISFDPQTSMQLPHDLAAQKVFFEEMERSHSIFLNLTLPPEELHTHLERLVAMMGELRRGRQYIFRNESAINPATGKDEQLELPVQDFELHFEQPVEFEQEEIWEEVDMSEDNVRPLRRSDTDPDQLRPTELRAAAFSELRNL